MISIHYIIDEEQILMQKLYNASADFNIRKRRILAWLFIPVLYGILCWIFYLNNNTRMVMFFGGFCLLWLIFYPLWEGSRYKSSYAKGIQRSFSSILGKSREITLNDQIGITTNDHTETYSAKDVIDFVYTKKYMFIRFKDGKTIAIPQSALNELQLGGIQQYAVDNAISFLNRPSWKWR